MNPSAQHGHPGSRDGGDGRLWHWDLFNLPQPNRFALSAGPNHAQPPKPEAPLDQGFALKWGQLRLRTVALSPPPDCPARRVEVVAGGKPPAAATTLKAGETLEVTLQ